MTKVSNFKVVIEQDDNGYFVASIPDVPGCHTQGKTYEEVLGNIKEALELCLEEARTNQKYAGRISYPQNSSREKFIGVIDLPVRFAV